MTTRNLIKLLELSLLCEKKMKKFYLLLILFLVPNFMCAPSYDSRMKSMGMVDYPSEDAQIERTGIKWEGKLGAGIKPLFFMDFSWDTLSEDSYQEGLNQGTITPTMISDMKKFSQSKYLTFQITIKSKDINESNVKNWTYFLETSEGKYLAPIDGSITSTGSQVTSSVVTPDISLSGMFNQGPGFSSMGSVSFNLTRKELIKKKITWIKLYFYWSVVGQQRVSELLNFCNQNIDKIQTKNIFDNYKKQFNSLTWNISEMEIKKTPKMKSLY